MSTNYYVKDVFGEKGMHVGLRSSGWKFTFEITRHGFENSKDWKNYIREVGGVVNEYGEELKPEEFWKMVDDWNNNLNNHRIYFGDDNKTFIDKFGYVCNKYEYF